MTTRDHLWAIWAIWKARLPHFTPRPIHRTILAGLIGAVLVIGFNSMMGYYQTPTPSQSPTSSYIASSASVIFHRRDCTWAENILPSNTQSYSTREEAIAGGHRPCRVCRP
jgi:hypothetical protein